MTEIIRGMELTHRVFDYQQTATNRTVSAVVGALYDIDAMKAAVKHLEDVRANFLRQPILANIGHRTLLPKDFGAFEVFCTTLARIGRKPFRDRCEEYDTTDQVAAIIAELYQPQPVYAKTKGSVPGYTLGRIIRTTAELVPDAPLENKLVLWLTTPDVRKGKKLTRGGHKATKLTEVAIDDIAAGLEARTDTGADTPVIAIGQRAVKGYVEHAYAYPRTERNASGNDSADILGALCESGMHLRELGFTEDEIMTQKHQTVASLGRLCGEGATNEHQALMLPPICQSLEEAIHIIDNARGEKPSHDIHPEFVIEYQRLLAMQ